YDQITHYDRKRPQPLHYNGEPMNYSRQYVTSGRIKKCETQSMLINVRHRSDRTQWSVCCACKRAEKFKRARYSEHGTKNLSTSPRLRRKLRRGPYDDDRGYPMKPLHHTPSSERNSTFDLDKDQGGMFKAKQTNRNTQGARPVQDSGDTRTDIPAQGYQQANGYSNYPNNRSRQTQPNIQRKPDTHREQ
ncbi:unnamed protein product, partial [Candidula unifasciata]